MDQCKGWGTPPSAKMIRGTAPNHTSRPTGTRHLLPVPSARRQRAALFPAHQRVQDGLLPPVQGHRDIGTYRL